jgi:hypothetical protein
MKQIKVKPRLLMFSYINNKRQVIYQKPVVYIGLVTYSTE